MLRLMTYNVRYFGHGTRGMMATRAGVRRIAASIAALQPLADVICLQEVETRSLRSSPSMRASRRQLDALLHELEGALGRQGVSEPYNAYYYPAHRYQLTKRTNFYTTGLAMLVRPRLNVVAHNASQPHDITHRRGAKGLKQTRICAHVAVEHPRFGRLDVFNTHMSLPGFFYPEFWFGDGRLGFGPNQLSEARRVIEAVRHHQTSDNVVLVGDFNSLPDSPVDRLLRAQTGLVDALAQNKGLSGERLRGFSTAGFRNMRMNIDRIYSSPRVKWLDFDGTHPFGSAPTNAHFAGLSDHTPLLGTLRLSA